MKWIFLSPHLDDIVFSCGGFIWDLVDQGENVEIWTIFAGDPLESDLSPLALELHQRWGLGLDAVQIRRDEDLQACQVLGAVPRYFSYLDCIYRKSISGEFYYAREGDIFSGLDPREADLIGQLSAQFGENLPGDARVVAPLGIGNHVDHELTRKAINRLGIPLLFYADYPYAREDQGQEILEFLDGSAEWQSEQIPISAPGMEKWILAARTYRSQISTFWEDDHDLGKQIREYSFILGGFRLWKAIEDHL